MTYGVELKGAVREYQQALLDSPGVKAWSADAVKETEFVAEDEPYAAAPRDCIFLVHGGFHREARALDRRAAQARRRTRQPDPQCDLRLIRLAWTDPHGSSRAKAVTAPAFLESLDTGYNINVATTTLDSAGARTFASFTRGGGMGLDEMTGSPNITIVPDPATFRMLPWAPGVGWVLCDEYFNSGAPFHFSARHLLQKLERLQGRVRPAHRARGRVVSGAGRGGTADRRARRRPRTARPADRDWPAEPGYSYHSETNMDLMQPVLSALAETYEALGLPLRSIENEWGPGQVECTFSAQAALKAADDLVLFRTATRQVCRRMGYFATFMCRPALKGYYSSGWHLHQSLVDAKTGENRFMPGSGRAPCRRSAGRYLGGLLAHAVAGDRVRDAHGERVPALQAEFARARPCRLGLRSSRRHDAGARRRGRSGDADGEPRAASRPRIPTCSWHRKSSRAAMASKRSSTPGPPDEDALRGRAHDAAEEAGRGARRAGEGRAVPQGAGRRVRRLLREAQAERSRAVRAYLEENRVEDRPDEPTAWEQNEYFDFF